MTWLTLLTKRWLWRSMLLLPLTLALVAAPAAQADDASPATITLYALGAHQGAPVSVQRQVGANWVTVDSWQGSLFGLTSLGVPYQTWTVDPADFGQGPFRWVIDNLDGRSAWATSDPFFLPMRGGIDLSETMGPADAPVGSKPGSASSDKTIQAIPAPAWQAPVLTATSFLENTLCRSGNCAYAQISAYITGLPLTSWIAVEWLDNQGYWQPVENWERPADVADATSQGMVRQWMIVPDAYGHGPFRWAIYSGPNGGVLGVSPSFNLPVTDRLNFIMRLSR